MRLGPPAPLDEDNVRSKRLGPCPESEAASITDQANTPRRRPDVAALFQTYYHPMYRRAASYLRDHGVDPSCADDVVSTVMTRLARRMPTNVGPDDWEAYLIAAALNGARDEVKAAARRRDHPDRFDPHDRDDADGPSDGPGEPQPRTRAELIDATELDEEIAHALDQERLLTQVRAAIAELPHDQQAVIRLHLQGRTGVQTAAELRLSAGRISQLKTAAIAALTHRFEGWQP